MKKKGLIISTIVMVVVLIASLTTATYAWFTATATATISQMTIQTSAAEGLQIAAVTFDEGAVTAYNGSLTLDGTSHKWVGETENGYGSELSLTNSVEGYLLAAMYGASGDGVNMFIQSDTTKLPSNANPMTAGVENVNYVALDFSLMATSAGTAYINQIYVDPTSFVAKSGMAGSMRIALFATAPGAPSGTEPTWAIASNGKMLYIPYGLTYNGVLFSGTPETNVYYTAAGTADPASVGTKSSDSLQTTWTSAKTVYGTKTATSGKTLSAVGNANNALYATLAAANAVIRNEAASPAGIASLGEMTANQVIYCRLVIWFEGESKACIQEFSGGGATVQINFSLETPSEP